MSSAAYHNISVSREAVTRLLASKPSRLALQRRLDTMHDLLVQAHDYFPWPALQASLEADAKRLRAALHRHG